MKDIVRIPQNANKNNNRQRNPQSNSRKKRRKSNLALYYFLVFIVILFALVVLSLTVFFNINKVTIIGTTEYSQEVICQAGNVKIGDNLFRKNLSEIEENILKNLINIDKIKVKRSLPSVLKIEVEPAVPTTNIENNGAYFVVSKNGKIIEENLQTPRENLVVIKGYELSGTALNTMIKSNDPKKETIVTDILSNIEALNFNGIDTIDISDRLNIILNFENRISIELGSSADLSYKINFVKVIIEENTAPNFEGQIIMRGDNGVSVIEKK